MKNIFKKAVENFKYNIANENGWAFLIPIALQLGGAALRFGAMQLARGVATTAARQAGVSLLRGAATAALRGSGLTRGATAGIGTLGQTMSRTAAIGAGVRGGLGVGATALGYDALNQAINSFGTNTNTTNLPAGNANGGYSFSQQNPYGAAAGAGGAGGATPPLTPQTDTGFTNPNLLDKGTLSSMVRIVFSQIGITGTALNNLVNQAMSMSDLEYGTILTLLKGSPDYQNRFAGNKLLIEKGKAPLDEATYLATERTYLNVLDNYGELLPPSLKIRDKDGNLRAPEEFVARWIGEGVDPQQLETRLMAAKDWATSVDPNLKRALQEFYNISENQIVQYALGTKEDKDTFLKKYQATKIGSEILGQGLLSDKALSEELVAKDVSIGEVRQAASEVAKNKETFGLLSGIEGVSLTEKELIKSELDLDAKAQKKTKAIRSKEESRFSGTGAGTNILGGSTSGMI